MDRAYTPLHSKGSEMNRTELRRLVEADFENLLETLTARQHLAPHESLSQTIDHAVRELGVCPEAAAEALGWLALPSSTKIGRLRRTELMQLARTMHRFWHERIAAATRHRQPL